MKRRGVPKILPREPMTKKARWAIWYYAQVKTKRAPIAWLMFKAILEGERMRRIDLYAWLERRGYQWVDKRNGWIKQGDER